MSAGVDRRAALVNLCLVLAATAAALLAAEGLARWWFPPPCYHDAPLQLDAELGFRGIPGYREAASDERGEFVFELDAEGWRMPAPGREAAPGAAPRLAFFGDSFLVGRGLRLDDLLPERVRAGLSERGVAVRVFNYSAIDYGTSQQLLVFRDIVERLQPAGVVVAFYTGNDIVNNEPALAGTTDVSAGDLVRPYLDGPEFAQARFLHPLRARLRSASRLFATLERRALALAERPGFAWLRPFPPQPNQYERQRAGRAPREGLEVLRRHDPGSAWEKGWERTLGMLAAFRQEAEAAGARFLVLVIPLEEQVERSAKTVAFDWAQRRASGVGLDDVLDWNLPERRLAEFFAAEGIDARFLAPRLRELAAAGVAPYARDRHLNPAGHARSARAVVDWWLGASPAEGEARDAPVPRLPPPGEAPLVLDFRREDHAGYLGDGWLEWRMDAEAEPGGWRIGPRSLAVVPDSGGAVVVRGHADADVAFPLAIVLEVPGLRPAVLQLREPGPFELRAASRAGAHGRARGYSVVLVGQRGAIDSPLRIQELGVEPGPGPPGGGRR